MSKRVEVREGDTWFVCKTVLFQQRGLSIRFVLDLADSDDGSWGKNGFNERGIFLWIEGEERHAISSERAKGYIVGSGGEWAEVAEEKKAKVVAYAADNGRIDLYVEGSEKQKDAEIEANSKACYLRRITITGVTQ